ncbi:MAG TPA: uracil-DNA glycosylase [Polyangiales bacterium]|nr:uracil-DNA glycosylase [Polyangiales bacterium]
MDPLADLHAELRELLHAARAQLEYERVCGSRGIQLLARPLPATPPAPRVDAGHPNGPAPRVEPAPPLAQPAPPPAAAGEDRLHRLAVLAQAAEACTACVLHEKRTKSVFARGSASSEIAFVGEGPGRDEDLQGAPFVGAAGKLLDKMIAAMGYGRDDVYVCNVVKCRPPENRTPRPEEMLACSKFLIPQLETVAPKLIVALGRCAAQALGVAEATGPWRGRFGAWRGIPVMPTYHPAFLLRSPEFKRTVWEDLQLVMGRLGRPRG